jgi:hypothetical protein
MIDKTLPVDLTSFKGDPDSLSSFDFESHVDNLSSEFKGDLSHLSSALGALSVGRQYGWKVLRITTSPLSYRRHQKILKLDFKDVLLSHTALSTKCRGYNWVEEFGNFWKVCHGEAKIDSSIKTTVI